MMRDLISTEPASTTTRSIPATSQKSEEKLGLLITCYVVLYIIFEGTGTLLAGYNHWGWLIAGAIVVAAAISVERFVFKRTWRSAVFDLGFGRPDRMAILIALTIGGLLLLCFPVIASMTGAKFVFSGGALGVIALFARNGIAEEVLYRGFLFRRLRQGRTFRRAAFLVVLLHAAAHAPLLRIGLAVGLGAMLVAAATTAPFAYLFERGGNTVWAAAIAHAAADTILLTIDRDALATTSSMLGLLSWYVAISTIPYLAFAFRSRLRSTQSVALPADTRPGHPIRSS